MNRYIPVIRYGIESDYIVNHNKSIDAIYRYNNDIKIISRFISRERYGIKLIKYDEQI
jgi:hypothetical protein